MKKSLINHGKNLPISIDVISLQPQFPKSWKISAGLLKKKKEDLKKHIDRVKDEFDR